MPTILDRWDISLDELTEVVDSNPSLQGFLVGYIGELKLRKMWFSNKRVDHIHKFDDHDRRHKNDMAVSYKGHEFTIEVKSLQTNSIRRDVDLYRGSFQCDASDRRTVVLPNRRKVETTCLLAGEFDLVAVNLFAFRHEWEFGFALNRDLSHTESAKYTPAQRKYLLATLMKISLPLQPPFVGDPFVLLDRLIAERGSVRVLTKTKK